MLSKLEIHNYILIDQLSIDLSNQLSVITGETGAGKSIIMGALGLILGDRADSTVCRDASKKCFIEGTFSLSNKQTYQAFFTEHDLDLTDEVIIRREINAQGKSRAFINDTPINLNELKQLTSQLVDLHQQFDTLTLGDTDFQRTVIDALAGVQKDLAQYQSVFHLWKDHQKQLAELISRRDEFEKTESYKKHLLEFKERDFISTSDLPYVRVWTKPVTTYAMNYSKFDISLAPIINHIFNRMKSQLKVIEAGFYKKALIASEIGPYTIDLKHCLKNGNFTDGNAILIPENRNHSDWSKSIKKLVQNPEMINELGERLFETVKDKYDLKNVTVTRAEFYKSLIK
jgi:recombinational DNA repair ATPase RecF